MTTVKKKVKFKHEPAEKVEVWKLDDIVPYERNPRTHPEHQIELLARLMVEHGVDQPIVVDEDGIIIKGHGRLLAAKLAGMSMFPVVVKRGLNENQKRADRLADNQVALLAGWDPELVRFELGELQQAGFDMPLIGFDREELELFGVDVGEAGFPELVASDRPSFQIMNFTLHDSQVEVVKMALATAKADGAFDGPNQNSNGNALARICHAYKRKGNSRDADR